MQAIETSQAPSPAGHYAQAMVHGDLVYVSGQLPIDPANGEKILGSIEDQTKQVLENLFAIVKAAGGSSDKIIKTTVYITDISLWDRVNKTYAECFGAHTPARAIVPTKDLHFGFKIEIDAIAALS